MTFLEDYFTREIGGLHRTRSKENCILLTRRMLCKVVVKDTRRKFVKLPTIASYGQVFYEDGKLFLAHKGTNSLDCHAIRDGGRGCENLSSALCQLYSIPLKPTIKYQELWSGPMNDERGRPDLRGEDKSSLRPCQFVLREDKTLTRYDVSNGNCLESAFLSSKRKFMELRFDAGRPNITVKSTQKSGFCNEDSCDHKKCNKTCIAFITFSYPRLKFLAHLEISQEAFGATLKNAVICDGFIIAIHANKTAKLYSLDYVLNKYMQQSYKIGESLPGLGIVGEAPLGFPLNVAIKHEANDGHGGEPAPVMYSVVCEDFDVAFSSFFPPMCVTTAKNDCYKVYNLKNHQTCQDYAIASYKRQGYEYNNDLVFHPDESRRVIHVAECRLFIHEIYPDDSEPSKLVFALNADPEADQAKSLVPNDNDDDDDDDEYDPGGVNVCYCFENELDILAVLGWRYIIPDDIEEYGDNKTRVKLEAVTLFDNNSYKKLRTITLDHAVRLGTSSGIPSVCLELDRDVLLVRVRTSSKTRTLIWRLLLREDDSGLEHDTSRQSNEAELRSIRSKSPHPQDDDWAASEYNGGLNDFQSDFTMTTRRTMRRKSPEYPRLS